MIKVTTAADVKQADKAKKARKAGDPNAPSFAELLETDDVSTPTTGGTMHMPAYAPILPDEGEPTKPSPKQLMKTLEDLAADLLTATPTQKAEELQKMLDNLPDSSGKTPEQKQVLDELATRAAATLAQLRKK